MVELRRMRDKVCLSLTLWMLTIELARICGWIPEGTRRVAVCTGSGESPDDLSHLIGWQTAYVAGDGQTVSTTDADHLAVALNRAAMEASCILRDWTEGRSIPPEDIQTPPRGFNWFATADGRTHLHSLVDFCRGGAFQIF